MMNAKILSRKNSSLDYKHGHNCIKILDSINLELHQNDILTILGESGSGKTSLAKLFHNLLNKSVKYNYELNFYNKNLLELFLMNLKQTEGKNFLHLSCPHTALNPLLTINKNMLVIASYKENYFELRIKPNLSQLNLLALLASIFFSLNL